MTRWGKAGERLNPDDTRDEKRLRQLRHQAGQARATGLVDDREAYQRWRGGLVVGMPNGKNRWDPTRILAEVEVKNRILDHAELWSATLHGTPEGWTEQATTAYRMAMEWVVQQLATPYADRPGHPG